MSTAATAVAGRYAPLTGEILDAVRQAGTTDEFILKSRVAGFEAAVARETGAAHAVACAGVTGAVTLALHALGVGRGDEVLMPAFGDLGAAAAVARSGALPVFADVDPERGSLTARHTTAVTGRTRAVLAPAGDADDGSGPPRIELQHGWATGTDRRTARPDSVRVVALPPDGLLGGIGDGAVILAEDARLAAALRRLRNHGQDLNIRFYHPQVGFNCRMDEVVAAFLLRRIAALPALTASMDALAQRYLTGLRTVPGARAVHGGHLAFGGLPVLVPGRARPGPAHPRLLLLPAQPVFDGVGTYPGAERFSRDLLVLPLHPDLTGSAVDAAVAAAGERS